MDSLTSIEAAPVHRLYRHALESIFQFASLKDLHSILSVNREWSCPVDSMQSIRVMSAVASIDQLSRIAQSRLSRHVIEVWGEGTSSLEGLLILSERMPWIETYRFLWDPDRGACAEEAQILSRLRGLKSLSLQLQSGTEELTAQLMDQSLAMTIHFLEAAGRMPQLQSLTLDVTAHDDRISLTPLIALAPSLRKFEFCSCSELLSAHPSPEQVAALRAMTWLEQFDHNFTDRNGTLRLILQAPTPPLRWTTLAMDSGANDLAPLLQSLPNLTALDIELNCSDVQLIHALPRLSALTLRVLYYQPSAADLSLILSTLQRCPQLTRLTLDSLPVTSAQLDELLPVLSHLSELKLFHLGDLTSLSSLSTEALASSLTHLVIGSCSRVPSSEIMHLLGLRSLRSLIVRGFEDTLTEEQWAQLRSVCPSVDE